jgi:hypothetical protein
VQQLTADHLTIADENRRFAIGLAALQTSGTTEYRWAAVAAFYAAVHAVNGYLWEKLRIEPRTHDERNAFVGRVTDLRPIAADYAQLQDIAFRARYHASLILTRQDVETLLAKLEHVHGTIVGILTPVE